MTEKSATETDYGQVVRIGDNNLVNMSAVSMRKYGRKIGHIIRSDDEIKFSHNLPEKGSEGHCRPAFDEEREKIGNVYHTYLCLAELYSLILFYGKILASTYYDFIVLTAAALFNYSFCAN